MSDVLLPFQAALLEEVKLGLEETRLGRNSIGILLLGESGTGKTHAADLLVDLFRPYRDGVQMMTPCLRLDANAIGGKESVPSAGLSQLGRQVRPRQSGLESMFMDAVMQQRVQLLVLEEFHNRLLSGKSDFRSAQGEFLKNLWNCTPKNSVSNWSNPNPHSSPRKLVIVVSGTPILLEAFRGNPELDSRFTVVIEAKPLGMFPNEEFRLFRQLMRAFAERFSLGELVNPDDNELAARCFFACEAHLRKLEKIFARVAAIVRHQHDEPDIGAIFTTAWAKEMKGAGPNPFVLSKAELNALVAKELKRFQTRTGGKNA